MDLLQLVVVGVIVGSVIGLGAMGLTLTFGILKFANFAHGDMMTLGMFLAYAIVGDLGWSGPTLEPFSIPLGLVLGVAVAALLPSVLHMATGSYQRASLRPDANRCTQGMLGEVQLREVTNICGEPIAVGLCLPGEINPAPCAQTKTLQPGETATFDPGEARLSSLPSNLDGLTVVACRPPARPSRMKTTMGRAYEGVCLPPE